MEENSHLTLLDYTKVNPPFKLHQFSIINSGTLPMFLTDLRSSKESQKYSKQCVHKNS